MIMPLPSGTRTPPTVWPHSGARSPRAARSSTRPTQTTCGCSCTARRRRHTGHPRRRMHSRGWLHNSVLCPMSIGCSCPHTSSRRRLGEVAQHDRRRHFFAAWHVAVALARVVVGVLKLEPVRCVGHPMPLRIGELCVPPLAMCCVEFGQHAAENIRLADPQPVAVVQ